ncbi:hypothetical protein [Trueperella abortisuis]|uniref:Anaerobic ribonucleoside-triphosphate reductase n=1 Tax=Trueperella abortisuis TaxID=445930 RepID=A0ABT9PH28_9ACTO|nr:hypothetical protein [Trueperella abortisuis]MDP9831450.1 anaerobic ribonucleoside-triphosphate reductase [Trueperella abortisuis]
MSLLAHDHTVEETPAEPALTVVKRTCGYLGNPVKRPMVHGRHMEISARVKHMDALE